jgi:hypothetical protein
MRLVTCALASVDMQDRARHEAGGFQVENRADNVGDLAHMAHWVQGVELRVCFDGMH